MKHALDFRTAGQPLRDRESGSFDGREAHTQCLQATQREAAIVGRDVATENLLRDAEALI